MPPIMAGIVSIYGLVVSVLIAGNMREALPLFTAFTQLGSGLAVGLSGLAAGYVMKRLHASSVGIQKHKTMG
jgi:V-type H+-transporting ATPase proteolipid subunit